MITEESINPALERIQQEPGPAITFVWTKWQATQILELAKDGIKWRENTNKKMWPKPLTPEEEASMPEDIDDD